MTAATDTVRHCRTCDHRGFFGNCTRPLLAGLPVQSNTGVIVYAPREHAAKCPEYTDEQTRIEREEWDRTTQAEINKALQPLGAAEIKRWQIRQRRLIELGLTEQDAERWCDRLALRDQQQDSLRACVECEHLAVRVDLDTDERTYECAVVKRSRIGAGPALLMDSLQRCPSFGWWKP